VPPKPQDPMILFLRHVDKAGPPCTRFPDLGRCWLWTGALKGGGYGQFNNGGKNHQAHRWLYEQTTGGPVPDGLVLDHFACDERRCVSPRHVRPVTPQENVLREFTGRGAGSKARQTHCTAGHELTPENTKLRGKRGGRDCLICHRRRQQEYLDRKAAR
jgi:hypothetical protein